MVTGSEWKERDGKVNSREREGNRKMKGMEGEVKGREAGERGSLKKVRKMRRERMGTKRGR